MREINEDPWNEKQGIERSFLIFGRPGIMTVSSVFLFPGRRRGSERNDLLRLLACTRARHLSYLERYLDSQLSVVGKVGRFFFEIA